VTFTVPADEGKDIIAWHAFPALRGGETYQLDAILSNPNQEQLEQAGTDYPSWVAEKYLQLPNEFSPRIQELAREITRDAVTPYEKTVLVTNYLRDNIAYAETISEAPRNRDALEWILFDYKQAYCLYYASAEVLMLRSLGVPARMAAGFAQGERDGNTYTVRRFNAHAWPEVYFPGIGWVEFEPTAGQAPLNRPLPPQELDPNNPVDPRDALLSDDNLAFASREQELEEGLDPLAQPGEITAQPPYWIAVLMILLGAVIYFMRHASARAAVPVFLRAAMERGGIDVPIWVMRWEQWGKLSPIERAFESINFGLRHLDQAVPVHITPIERAAKLSRILPTAADQIKVLLDEHQTSLYTSRAADVTQARQAAFSIRKQTIIERIRYLFLGKPLR
jgi:transglutaminase-like putative cysteine protease